MEIIEVSRMINDWLPADFDIPVAASREPLAAVNLELVNLDLTTVNIDGDSTHERLVAIIYCHFEVKMNHAVIFRTNLELELHADPNYCLNSKSIGICNAKLSKVTLVDGKDSFIKDVSTLANGILPSPLKGLFNVAMASTSAILGDEIVSGMTKYLSLYNFGNQQRIVDYHQKDIEDKIIELTQDADFRYQLNMVEFEEKLFSDYGKKIILREGKLVFVF